MLSVHVNPALNWGAVDGFWGVLGVFWTDVLGRASVAALSLISGYLLVGSLAHKEPLDLIADRFRSIYLPMVLWNAIFIVAVMLAGLLFDAQSSSLPRLAAAGPVDLVVERLFHVYGTPAVEALAFLRDLLVSTVMLVAALRVAGRYLGAILPLLVFISLFGTLEPVVYRPNILLFMTVGVVLRQYAVPLELPRKWRVPLLIAFGLAVLARFAVQGGLLELTGTSVRLENLVLRTILTLVFLDLSGVLIRSSAAEWLADWEPHMFLAYLSHTSVISALWLLWNSVVGRAELPAYGAFFLLAPVVALAAARLAAPIVGMLPRAAQIAIRGKAVRGRAVRAAARPLGSICDKAASGSL